MPRWMLGSTLFPERGEVDRPRIERASRPGEEPVGLRLAPTAVLAVVPEFIDDVVARKLRVHATARLRLSFLLRRAISGSDADMSAVLVRVTGVRIGLVANLGREREQARIAHALLGECVEP